MEAIISEKYTDISDWSDEDKIIIDRSFTPDNLIGYNMLERGGQTGPRIFKEISDELKKKYPNNPEGDDYRSVTHVVLNVIAHQVVDGASYNDAVKLEIERAKSNDYIKEEVKNFIIDVIKDGAGKDIKNFRVHISNQFSGFGSRKDLEKRLAKIKSDPKNLHKYLKFGF